MKLLVILEINNSFRHFTTTRILAVTSPSLTQPKNEISDVTESPNFTENLIENSSTLGKQIAMKHFLIIFLILLLTEEQKRPLCHRIKKTCSPEKNACHEHFRDCVCIHI